MFHIIDILLCLYSTYLCVTIINLKINYYEIKNFMFYHVDNYRHVFF